MRHPSFRAGVVDVRNGRPFDGDAHGDWVPIYEADRQFATVWKGRVYCDYVSRGGVLAPKTGPPTEEAMLALARLRVTRDIL